MAEIETSQVNMDDVEGVVAEAGYDASIVGEGILRIRDLDSGISIQAALEENVLFMTVSCMVVSEETITADVMRKMLDADNGISTSSFQLYKRDNGQVAVTLNNFCKLQAMGPDDQDDILSCIEFLIVDCIAASQQFGKLNS